MKFAYLGCMQTLPCAQRRRADAIEHDQMMAQLVPAFAHVGAQIEDVSWDDQAIDWRRYNGAIIGTTWDYCDRVDEFLQTLKRINDHTPVFNGLPLVEWNIHKTYLRELEAKGAAIVPTLWVDKLNDIEVQKAFDQFSSPDIIVKQQVGANAEGQYRLTRKDDLLDTDRPMMVQPFLPAIEGEGEYSFIFIDGSFSHALLKKSAPGEYRIQSSYGGREEKIIPMPEDIEAALAVVNVLEEVPLYARVDMVRGDEEQLLLMELELIEPFLYPLQGPAMGDALAKAVIARVR